MMDACCETCFKWLGLRLRHEDGVCIVRAEAYCTTCSCKGHIASECNSLVTHVERPRTLEELIPLEVRMRWNIMTSTPIVWRTTEDVSNTILLRYHLKEGPGKLGLDKTIRKYLRKQGITTGKSMNDNSLKLQDWATRNGQKIVYEVIKE